MKYILKGSFVISFLFFVSFFVVAQNQYIGIWGSGGYSSLYHGVDNTKVPGGIGAALGIGYEYNLNQLVFLGGMEFSYLNSVTKLSSYTQQYNFLYPYLPNHIISYYYSPRDYKEKHSVGYLNIPLQAGMKFNNFYCLLGIRIGINLFGNYKTDASLDISATDPMLIDTLRNMPTHYIGTKAYNGRGALNIGLNITPGFEFGMYLDEWLSQNNRNRSYRAGVFVDYGISNINKSETVNPLITQPQETPYDISLNNLPGTTLSEGKRLGTLFAGFKFTVLFQMRGGTTKAPKNTKSQAPTPVFNVQVKDAETNNNIEADIVIRYSAGNREVLRNKTDESGVLSRELRRGRYIVIASADGYSEIRKTITHNKADTLKIMLQQLPNFYVHVTDAETNENLHATVSLYSEKDNKQIFSKETAPTNGMLSHVLKSGNYQINVTSEGYIYSQQMIEYKGNDTIHITLQPVKKDTRVILHNLLFEFNSAIISTESEYIIDNLYNFLIHNPDIQIQIVGHTDNVGSDLYNKTLSENRAKAVYDAIVKKGIAENRLSWLGKGATDPIATNETEQGRGENRRVEFIIQ